MRSLRVVFGIFAFALVFGQIAVVEAQEEDELESPEEPVSDGIVDLALAGGIGLPYGDPVPDPWGPGMGLRVGKTLDWGLRAEFQFDYYVGDKADVLVEGTVDTPEMAADLGYLEGATVDLRATREQSTMFIGQLLGFDWSPMDSLVVRPGVVAGIQILSSKQCVEYEPSCTDEKLLYLYVAPTVQAIYSLGDIFVGPEVRWNLVMGDSEDPVSMISAALIAGYHF